MYPDPYSKWNTFVPLQLLLQIFYRIQDTQASAYYSLCVIFMGDRVAKIHQETIT
jgi:hypothetical protein